MKSRDRMIQGYDYYIQVRLLGFMPKIPTAEKATVIYHCFETLTSHHFGSVWDETCCHLVRKSQPLTSCETQPRLPNKTFTIGLPTILKNKYT